MVAIPFRGWQRVAVVALLSVPLVLVVLSAMPMVLVSVFLGEPRRRYVLDLVNQIIKWVRVIALAVPPVSPGGTARQ
jgi:hypothetical protein